jgi:hypothetical protein
MVAGDTPMSSKPEKDKDEKSADGKKSDSEAPPPIDKKIPESPETLRRRSEWFRKRSE